MLTQEQLEIRKSGIGGSDCAAILGISPWRSPLDVYEDKTKGLYFTSETEAMYFGSLHEPMLLSEFQRRNPELEAWGCNVTERSKKYDWFLASPDGFVLEDGEKGIWEAKTAKSDRGWEDGIPDHYITQLNHYLLFYGLGFAYLSVLIGGNEYRQYKYEPNNGALEEQFILMKEFWEKHVAPKAPPKKGHRATFAELSIILPTPEEGSEYVVQDDFVMGVFTALRTAIETKSTLDGEIDKLKSDLVRLTGGAKKIVDNHGNTLAVYVEITPKPSLNTKKIMQEQPQLADLYKIQRKPYRSLRTYKVKS